MHRICRATLALSLGLQVACAPAQKPSPLHPAARGTNATSAPEATASIVQDTPVVLDTFDEQLEEASAASSGLEVDSASLSLLAAKSETTQETPHEIHLFDMHAREPFSLSVYADGRVPESMRPQVEAFFRCRRSGKTHEMAPGVLRILVALHLEFEGRVIEVVSGFRTYPYGVSDSKHYRGNAIDLRVRGVKTTRVRDFVWQHFADVGVGYYGHQNFVHVDYRPEEKDTAWSSPEPNAPYAYNPSWALRIRRPWQAPRELAEAAPVVEPQMLADAVLSP